MQEFTSISVSSYEADTLAALLNEKSGDGWDVVAIVPTGSTVTAYLSKDKSEASAASESTTPADDQAAHKAADDTTSDDTTSDDTTSDDTTSDDETAAVPAAAAAAATTPADDKPVVDPLTVGAASAVAASAANDKVNADVGGEPAKSAVDEPAGWAVGASGAGATAGAAASNPTPATAATTTASTPGAAATSAPAAAAAASSTPSAAAAPAGWYADPSSRYELRYWDGSQWTEHVSRAGQQFTDPPVA